MSADSRATTGDLKMPSTDLASTDRTSSAARQTNAKNPSDLDRHLDISSLQKQNPTSFH